MNLEKNRNRDEYSFANINLLGKCNVDCFFCLGKDLEKELKGKDQRTSNFINWKNFGDFIELCKKYNIQKIYITGQNTDPFMYRDLFELVHYLQDVGFNVGLRTNGYLAEDNIKLINECKETIGYSIHTLSPTTNKMIMGRSDIPNWNWLLRHTNDCRVSIVLNRCNESEFFSIVKFISQFPKVKYIQVRRVSSDNRMSELEPDMSAYERIYTQVSKIFPLIRKFWNDAEEYSIYNKSVCFWRTIRTSVNSLNYFTDGTISDMYFIVEGYLKYMQKQPFEETGVDPERDWGI